MPLTAIEPRKAVNNELQLLMSDLRAIELKRQLNKCFQLFQKVHSLFDDCETAKIVHWELV